MEEGINALKIPAPKVETGDNFARTKLYWYANLLADENAAPKQRRYIPYWA